MFDIDTDTLVEIEGTGEPPCPREGHGSVVIRNILYVFGGYDVDENYENEYCNNDIHSFNPVST